MSEKLKPCPFCGSGEVEILEAPATIPVPECIKKQGHFAVYCGDCELMYGYDVDFGGIFRDREEAAKAWNGRAKIYVG